MNKEVKIQFPLHVISDTGNEVDSICDDKGQILAYINGSSFYSWEHKAIILNIVKILNQNAGTLSTIDVSDFIPAKRVDFCTQIELIGPGSDPQSCGNCEGCKGFMMGLHGAKTDIVA